VVRNGEMHGERAEREPITEVLGLCLHRVSGIEPLVSGL